MFLSLIFKVKPLKRIHKNVIKDATYSYIIFFTMGHARISLLEARKLQRSQIQRNLTGTTRSNGKKTNTRPGQAAEARTQNTPHQEAPATISVGDRTFFSSKQMLFLHLQNAQRKAARPTNERRTRGHAHTRTGLEKQSD
jgi:hypothetical protein